MTALPNKRQRPKESPIKNAVPHSFLLSSLRVRNRRTIVRPVVDSRRPIVANCRTKRKRTACRGGTGRSPSPVRSWRCKRRQAAVHAVRQPEFASRHGFRGRPFAGSTGGWSGASCPNWRRSCPTFSAMHRRKKE